MAPRASAFRQRYVSVRETGSTSPGASSLSISVNVSAKQLTGANFVPLVTNIVDRAGLDATKLNIAVTESAIMENAEAARSILRQLREFGLGIHLDDFGTGYSSLSYLRDFPVSTLKIDRSFVSGAEPGVSSDKIVRAIIALARSLDSSVTAEGIETSVQLAAFRRWKCSSGQGYYFSAPVDADSARALIVTGSAVDSTGSGLAAIGRASAEC